MPLVAVEFEPLRPLEDELLVWMAYKTTTMYVAFGLSREQLGLACLPVELKTNRFDAVVLEVFA